MKSGKTLLERLIERMDQLDPASIQAYILRLVREKDFLETIFNAIEEGVIVVDSRLRVRYINQASRDLLGIQEEAGSQRIDRYLRDVDWRPLLEADSKDWKRVSRQEIEVFYPVHRFLSFYLVPVRTDADSEELPLAIVILNDVTAAQEDKVKTIESKRIEAITMLAAGVAHELGNPLNSLEIHLQLLERCLAGTEDAAAATEAEELLRVARQEVERLDTIVNNFLRAVRPVPLKPKQLTIQEVLAEALAFMRIEIESRNIQVEASWPDSLPTVIGDRDQLKQAFYNIIKNAIQAMPDGGQLQIVCRVRENLLDIRFSDTGKGISKADMSRIMDPYFSTRVDGTGLGLLIVERIVRTHGGELGIDAEEGKGTAFTISLPLRERQVRLLKAAQAAAQLGSQPDPPLKHRGTEDRNP